MPDSLEYKLKGIAAEIAAYEVEANKLRHFQSQAFLTHQPFPIEKQMELEEFHRKISEAQQKQMSYLLASIGESSARLETATKNLKDSSESQVEVTKKLLWSSNRLEKISLLLLVVAAATITVIVQNQLVFPIPLLLVAAVFILLFLALRTPWEKDKPT